MSSYRDRQGVWAVWDYGNDGGPQAASIHSDVVPAVREAESYQSILFWPFEMSLRDAIDWWKQPEVMPPFTDEDRDEIHDSVQKGWMTGRNSQAKPEELIDIITDQIVSDLFEGGSK